jgi:hypothetical protein
MDSVKEAEDSFLVEAAKDGIGACVYVVCRTRHIFLAGKQRLSRVV